MDDSDESLDEIIPYMDDSESDFDGVILCPECKSGEGIYKEWLGCDMCPCWWHIDCVEEFCGEKAPDLNEVCFQCEICR